MKKIFTVSVLALLSFYVAQAQENDKMLFNHLSVGVTTGTPGLIGFDVATTCTPYVQIRAGFAIMPKFKYSTSIDIDGNTYNGEIYRIKNNLTDAKRNYQNYGNFDDAQRVQSIIDKMYDSNGNLWEVAESYDVEGKFGFANGKILFDIFPFTSNKFPFFVTVGAYFGSSNIISVYNKQEGSLNIVNSANEIINDYNKEFGYIAGGAGHINNVYANLGDYKDLGPDQKGNVEFNIKVSGFKPYLGIGFGRPVPKKSRVGFVFELGCMFWNTPKLVFHGNQNIDIEKDKAGNDDIGEALDIISKFSVYPCLNFRLCGKIF